MTAADNKELIRKMFAALAAGDTASFMNSLADDVQFTVMGTTRFSATYCGKDELVNKLLGPLGAELATPLVITPQLLIAEGEYVAMEAGGKSTTKSGKPYDNRYCQVFRVVSGKVKEIREYLDTELVTQAFGK